MAQHGSGSSLGFAYQSDVHRLLCLVASLGQLHRASRGFDLVERVAPHAGASAQPDVRRRVTWPGWPDA